MPEPHTLYSGPAGTGRLVITARPGLHVSSSPVWLVITARPGLRVSSSPVWLVEIQRWGRSGKTLDRTAAWLPVLSCWDESRWFPSNPRQVPPAVLADVVAWLRGREVEA